MTNTNTAVTKQRQAQEKEASARAVALGHKLSDFATCYGDRVKAYSEAYCLNSNCSAVAAVNVKAPEGRQVAGIATILPCLQVGSSNSNSD